MIKKIVERFKRKDDCLCVAVTGRQLTAAVVGDKGSGVFKVMQKTLPDAAEALVVPEVLQDALEQLLRENKLASVGKLLLVLDGDAVFLQRLVLPQMPQAELREALKWEAEEYVPFAGKPYRLDYLAAPPAEGMQAVLLAALPQEVLAQLFELSRRLQLKLAAVTVLPLAQAAFLQQRQGNFLLAKEREGVVKLTAFIDGLPAAAAQVYADTAAVEKEVAALAATVWQKYNVQLRNIFYTDGGVALAAWQEGVRELYGQQYCLAAADFTGKLSWQGGFLNDAERRQCAAAALTAAGSALLADGDDGINFISSGETTGKVKAARYLAAALLLVTAAVWCGAYAYNLYQISRIEKLQQQIAVMDVWRQRYAAAQLAERSIREYDARIAALENKQFGWGSFLELLGRTIPQGCWLNRVQQGESQHEVFLYGKAESLGELEKFISSLQGSGSFTGVELRESKEERANGLLGYTVRAVAEGSGQNE